MISGKRLPRLVVQLICFVAASVLLWPLPFWKSGPRFLLQVSPFAAICSSVALRVVGVGTFIGLAAAAVGVVRHRWFCRFSCPVGLMLEGISRIGLRRTSWWTRLPHLGKYAALLTLAGAALGYPLLLWMDPLAIFSGAWGARMPGTVTSAILCGSILLIVALLSLTSGQVWCSRICPLGGTQEMLASAGLCWKGRKAADAHQNSGSSMRTAAIVRRSFLVGAAGTGMGLIATRIGAARGESAPLRPPGSVAEGQFAGQCLRCGNCIRACPTQIIAPDTGVAGFAGLLAPTIHYTHKYCLENCYACTQVCPSGAITRLELEQKRRYIIGEALVDGSICFVTLGTKDCDVCERSCPYSAVKIFWDEERYAAYPLVDTKKCNGCGACEVACPTGKTKAIRVWKRTDKSVLNSQ